MQIDFYTNFYKRENSTKRPSVGGAGNLTASHTVTGNLKEPCSVLNPIISLQNTPVQSMIPAVCTYAYIPRFYRYYWVTDWAFENGLWVAYLKVDVLATWRNEIGEQDEYILRTDSSNNALDCNEYITDIIYPATTDFEFNEVSLSSAFTSDIDAGCYIVGIISGGSADAVGAITYYALTSAQFGALKTKLFSDDNLEIMGIIDSGGVEIVQDISQEVLKTMYNPFQYIASCMWFPFTTSSINVKSSVSTIKIGWWDYSLSGFRLYAQQIQFGETGTLALHPQSETRGQYLNYAPYTRRTLIGRFGTVALDSSYYKLGNSITITYLVDLITGQCLTRIGIYDSSDNPPRITTIAERNFLLAVPIQIAQVGTDYLSTVANAVGTIGGAVGGAVSGLVSGGIAGAISGAVGGVANGIYNTIASAMPQVETSGSNGSFLAPANATKILSHFFKITDENITHIGRPLCAIRKIKNLSGYVLCAEGEINLDCYDSERKDVAHYLTTGFFWE